MTAALDTYPHELAGPPTDAPAAVDPAEAAAWLASLEPAGPVLFDARPAYLAPCLVDLRNAANVANPGRDKSSDGWIGDAAHAARASLHNPDANGAVRAIDVDSDGVDVAGTAERVRLGVLAGRLPAFVGGHLIVNRRITSPDFTAWRVYTGANPHTSHAHFGCSSDPARYGLRLDTSGLWTPSSAPRPPAPKPAPTRDPRILSLGSTGARVHALQRALRQMFPAYRHVLGGRLLAVDGDYGPATEAWVREFQRRSRLTVDGIAGPVTLGRLGLW